MLQMTKGGKYIFGWSKIGQNGELTFPTMAVKEYNLQEETYIYIVSGSKQTGGFSVMTEHLLLIDYKLKEKQNVDVSKDLTMEINKRNLELQTLYADLQKRIFSGEEEYLESLKQEIISVNEQKKFLEDSVQGKNAPVNIMSTLPVLITPSPGMPNNYCRAKTPPKPL